MKEGLKVKYEVRKANNDDIVYDCFVLRPNKDPAAMAALKAYARHTDNKELAKDLMKWINIITKDLKTTESG